MSEIPPAAPEPEVGTITGVTSVQALSNLPMMTHDEAEALRMRTLKQERISAILVAVLVHALIIVGLALWGLGVLETEKPPIDVTFSPTIVDIPKRDPVKLVSLQRPPAAPTHGSKYISTPIPVSAVFVPDVPVESNAFEIGNSNNLGVDIGISDLGPGDRQRGIKKDLPPVLQGRCTLEERMKRLTESGGTKECEDAVVKSLTWLQLKQNADGSWGRSHKTSMTGLALLAYLGHCETPQSTQFGETVLNGILYLVDLGMKNDGYFTANRQGNHWVYEHAIGVYALGEAFAFTDEMKMDIPNLKVIVEKGTDIILAGQHASGGWDYNYNKTGNRGGDTSVVGWQVQALKAAKNAGYGKKFGADGVLMRSVNAAQDYIETVQNDEGSIGYTSKPPAGKETYGLQGVGSLCFQMFDKQGRVVSKALRVARNTPLDYNADTARIYAWYYTTQAMFFKGGAYWNGWNKDWRDMILENQGSDGAWKQEGGTGGGSSSAAGPDSQIYRNCLCTLMLEVYYRYLPGTGS